MDDGRRTGLISAPRLGDFLLSVAQRWSTTARRIICGLVDADDGGSLRSLTISASQPAPVVQHFFNHIE